MEVFTIDLTINLMLPLVVLTYTTTHISKSGLFYFEFDEHKHLSWSLVVVDLDCSNFRSTDSNDV